MNERRYIIVDEDNQPMRWHKFSKQIVYVKTIGYSRLKLETYTKKDAEQAIIETVGNRLKWKMNPGRYYLMPIDVTN